MRRIFVVLVLLWWCASGCALLQIDPSSNPNWDDPASNSSPSYGIFDSPAQEPPAVDRRAASINQEAYDFSSERSNGELYEGMALGEVRRSWGEPVEVEVAGDPDMGNQRWIYFNGLTGRYGLRDSRVVYFERGRVVGWETVSR